MGSSSDSSEQNRASSKGTLEYKSKRADEVSKQLEGSINITLKAEKAQE